ncbi:RodZ domain-containing protein [Deinococcus altitudinis]|uniref:RodZ domain-containing protein n=1 Tax=Deinococcus altitudinis TaxID=468914 RepID=UPI0038914A2F
MSFGNELKAAREAQALSIQDVAQKIKVRGDYLRALEAENMTVLPERTFARSYLQSYGRELGLEPAALLRDFDRLMPQPAEQVNNLRRPGKLMEPSVKRGLNAAGLVGWLLGGALLLGVAGYLGYSAYSSRSTLAATAQDGAAATPANQQVRLSLSSTPSGARVYLDNRYLGLTPVKGFPLDARAQAALRVEYGGRQSYQERLNLQSSRNLSISLVPMTAAQLAAQAAATKASAKAAAQAAAQAAAARAAQAVAARAAAGTGGPAASASQTATAQTANTQPANTQAGNTQAATAQTPAATTPTATGTPAAGTPATATTATATPATAPASGVRLTWAGASWTRVTAAGGQVLYQGIPASGSSRDFPSGVTVRTGSAGLVTATVGGGQPQKLGTVGAVVTRSF